MNFTKFVPNRLHLNAIPKHWRISLRFVGVLAAEWLLPFLGPVHQVHEISSIQRIFIIVQPQVGSSQTSKNHPTYLECVAIKLHLPIFSSVTYFLLAWFLSLSLLRSNEDSLFTAVALSPLPSIVLYPTLPLNQRFPGVNSVHEEFTNDRVSVWALLVRA